VYAKQALAASQDDLILPMELTFWYETEALLRGGDGNLARREVERVTALVGENRRYRLPLLRSQAVLAQWDSNSGQALNHLQAALGLAQEIGLPGGAWPLLGALGGLYEEQEEEAQAQEVYGEAGTIIHRLAETIDEAALRVGFLTAGPVGSVLEMSEGV
jgi:hypothetical protein